MSLSSRVSDLDQLREALLQSNSELFITLSERRKLCIAIQEVKGATGRFSHYDPEREKSVFEHFKSQLTALSIRELLAFSLVMEDHALAMAPGSYPYWSQRYHLTSAPKEIHEMVNPLMLKISHPDMFARLELTPEFHFLKDL
jgi:chorismate mutase